MHYISLLLTMDLRSCFELLMPLRLCDDVLQSTGENKPYAPNLFLSEYFMTAIKNKKESHKNKDNNNKINKQNKPMIPFVLEFYCCEEIP